MFDIPQTNQCRTSWYVILESKHSKRFIVLDSKLYLIHWRESAIESHRARQVPDPFRPVWARMEASQSCLPCMFSGSRPFLHAADASTGYTNRQRLVSAGLPEYRRRPVFGNVVIQRSKLPPAIPHLMIDPRNSESVSSVFIIVLTGLCRLE